MSFCNYSHFHFYTSPTTSEWLYTCIISWSLDLEDEFYPAFTTTFLHRSSVMPFTARESWKDFIPADDTRLQILIYSYNVLFDGPGEPIILITLPIVICSFSDHQSHYEDATRSCFSIIFSSPSSYIFCLVTFPPFLHAMSRRILSYFHIGFASLKWKEIHDCI